MKLKILAKRDKRELELISLSTAAGMLRITRQAMLKKINAGQIPAVRTNLLSQDTIYLVFKADILKIKRTNT